MGRRTYWGRRVISLLFCLCLTATLVFGNEMPAMAASRTPVLAQKSAKYAIGQSRTIKVRNASKKNLKFKSNKKKIATVSKKGKVKALKPGTAKITVTVKKGSKRKKLKYTVKVCKPTVAIRNATVTKGRTVNVGINYKPAKSAKAKYKWSSSNKGVATVRNGVVTGIAPGSATIKLQVTVGKKKYVSTSAVTVVTPSGGKSKPETAQTISNPDQFGSACTNMINDYDYVARGFSAKDGEFATGRLIVKSKGAKLDFSAFGPAAVLDNSTGVYFVQFTSAAKAKSAFRDISQWDNVEWAEPDRAVETTASDAQSGSFKSWGVQRINADKYAEYVSGKGGSVSVGVVDSGVCFDHTMLAGRLRSDGADYVDGDNRPDDEEGHGTHVSGIIVDCTPGLNVSILPVRCLNEYGRGYDSAISNGIIYAANHGCKVINLSLGGEGHSSYLHEAVEYAVNKGVTVVAAAGNEGMNTARICPADMEAAIVVAATDSSNNRWSESNFGNSVDVAAPGVEILSAYPGGDITHSNLETLTGTSMAAPHVAAAAAMIKLEQPSASPAVVESRIRGCTVDLGSPGWDKYYGYGIPDLSRLMTVQPEKVTLDPQSYTLNRGESKSISATVLPETAQNKTLSWTSSNTSVATVNNGTVKAVNEGTAVITASASNGVKGTCRIVVRPDSQSGTGEPVITSVTAYPGTRYIVVEWSDYSLPEGANPEDQNIELWFRANGKEAFLGNIYDGRTSFDFDCNNHGNIIKAGAVPEIGDTVEVGVNYYYFDNGAHRSKTDWRSVKLEENSGLQITDVSVNKSDESMLIKWQNDCDLPDDANLELWIQVNGKESFLGNIYKDDPDYISGSYLLPYTGHGNLIRDGAVPQNGDDVRVGIGCFYSNECSRTETVWYDVSF